MTDAAESHQVIDDAAHSRYQLRVGDVVVSTADYRHRDDVVIVTHVETVPHLRGQGMSDRLMSGLLDDVRARGLRIETLCWAAAAYVRDHPGDADLLAS